MSLPLAAVIAAAAAIVFLLVLLFLPRPGFEPEAAIYLRGTGAAPEARGVVLWDTGAIEVFASELSELERGYRYVVWAVDADGYRRLGSLVVLGGGRARVRLAAPALPEQLEITIEPSTATGDPAGPTILAGFADLRVD